MCNIQAAIELIAKQFSRYTVTYTPSHDRILPSPEHLHVKVKNTSPIALRAAYLHGPYSLHVSTYPSTYNPNKKVEDPQRYGIPEFEPFLKAGSHWTCKLTVPEEIRESGARASHDQTSTSDTAHPPPKQTQSMTWIVEIASQVIFSVSATVHFEVLIGRDERSLELGFAAVAGHGHGAPGQVHDNQKDRKRGDHAVKGIYSRAIKLVVEDTEALWDKPKLPTLEELKKQRGHDEESGKKPSKRKVHLVVLTHGLHSNLSADMLYMKESIDATVRQAREDARSRKQAYRAGQENKQEQNHDGAKLSNAQPDHAQGTAPAPLSGGQEDLDHGYDEDEEQVIVRGFTGNAVRTERGIQYLGKRMAKFVMETTYPSQPYVPIKRSVSRKISDKFSNDDQKSPATIHGSGIHRDEDQPKKENDLAYTFTSISFIGHSLGGLIQMYAIAYIQKHAPDFFQQIKPINFICMASPLLGLSNENPMYVKFALDFGLVGRTGQDLGLTWRPPTIAKSGWDAMLGGFGAGHKDPKQDDPGAKPLLRILPTGPAHVVLHMFRNRTLYSNVVNDGIVPLRTSCLLFLDWKGLGKVDKARRDNGLIGTMVEWGYQELTGANAAYPIPGQRDLEDTADGMDTSTRHGEGDTVPQPSENATQDDNRKPSGSGAPLELTRSHRSISSAGTDARRTSVAGSTSGSIKQTGQTSSFLGDVFSFFRPKSPTTDKRSSSNPKVPKVPKALRRGQTLSKEEEEKLANEAEEGTNSHDDDSTPRQSKRPAATRGDTFEQAQSKLHAPPKTSVFEAASDILHPPLPSVAWITDPSSRQRTIFHDRVYHPEDIPPPPTKRPTLLARTFSSEASNSSVQSTGTTGSNEPGNMKVEEKIARAYHRDLSWRKVLVRLEPDAHNNMIVRRMFANAYGWPVVKHLCDTHFANTWSATTRDEDEPSVDRAKSDNQRASETGEEVRNQVQPASPKRTSGEMREVRDELGALNRSTADISKIEAKHNADRDRDSGAWDDAYFFGSDDDDEEEEGYTAKMQRFLGQKRHGYLSPQLEKDKAAPPLPRRPSSSHGRMEAPVPTSSSAQPKVTPTEPVAAEQLTSEPESLETSSTRGANSAVDVGLRKGIAEQLMPAPKKGEKKGGKAAEVMTASAKGDL